MTFLAGVGGAAAVTGAGASKVTGVGVKVSSAELIPGPKLSAAGVGEAVSLPPAAAGDAGDGAAADVLFVLPLVPALPPATESITALVALETAC